MTGACYRGLPCAPGGERGGERGLGRDTLDALHMDSARCLILRRPSDARNRGMKRLMPSFRFQGFYHPESTYLESSKSPARAHKRWSASVFRTFTKKFMGF